MDQKINEIRLFEGIRERDDKCFKYIYQYSYSYLHSFIIRNGGSSEDVKDIMQDGLVILYENISQGIFEGRSGILTYFNSICRNTWLNYLKRRKSKNISLDAYAHSFDSIYEQNDHEDQYETWNYVETLILSASDRCKEILIAFYYDNLSMADIAGKLGYTNAENAKSQKAKCMDKLRNAVKGSNKLKSNDVIGKGH